MIDLEKVIKGLEICSTGHCEISCPFYNAPQCTRTILSDALAMLKEQEWNVLTEDADGVIHGLPGDDGQYIMTDGKDIWIDDYVNGVEDGIILDSGRDIREITAWMYTPELPKKGRR